jgi:hypothetical protein
MAPSDPEEYTEVVVPEGHNVWMLDEKSGVGRMAKAGEVVKLHKVTLDRDPVLAHAVKKKSDKPEPDMYDKASMAQIKQALDNRNIEYDTTSKDELANIARSNGVSQQELDLKLSPPTTKASK